MNGEPAIRALWGRLVLRRRARMTPDELAAWNTRVRPDVVARLESEFPMQWLPASDILQLVDASEAVLGARYTTSGYEHVMLELGRPPFAAILRGVTFLTTGNERRSVGPAIEILFSTVCRDAGTMTVEDDGDDRISIWHRDPPAAFVSSAGYRRSFGFVTRATLSVAGLTGSTAGFVQHGKDLVCRVDDVHRQR